MRECGNIGFSTWKTMERPEKKSTTHQIYITLSEFSHSKNDQNFPISLKKAISSQDCTANL